MNVENWMKRDLVTVRPDDNLLKADRLMTAFQIRHLPVLNERGGLCGIVSDRDIRDHSPPPPKGKQIPARQKYLEKVKIDEVMTEEVVTITVDAPMERAVRIMKTRRIDSLPVLQGEELVGIVTSSNLLSYFNDVLGIEAGSMKVELELGLGSEESIRMVNAATQLDVPFSGLIGQIDQEAKLIRFSFFHHKSKMNDVRKAFEEAGIKVVRMQHISE